MATARAGRNARMYIDTSSAGTGSAVPVSLQTQWTLDQSMDTFDVTAFGDSTKTYVSGLPDAQGTFSGTWDADETLLYNIIGSSTARKLYLYPDRLNDAATYFFTTAFFSLSFDASVSDAVKMSGNYSAASVASWVVA